MLKQDCLPIGTIVKTHGIHGELVIEVSNSKLVENIKELVFLEIEGLPVPFFIEQIYVQSTTRIRATFLWTKTESKAKKLIGCKVLVEKNNINLSDTELFETPELLKNFTVIDKKHGKIGVLTDITENFDNPLMVITQDKKEFLIPFNSDFIKEINQKENIIYTKTPDGLINLYLE